jgi:hypothetical protein
MTYTFKLARRLAVSRTFVMLPAILLFAACGGDATAPENSTSPDSRPRVAVPVTVSVNPGKVTVETNQLIRFLAHGTTSAGDSVGATVEWSATGGTILPDGRFAAAATGTFLVFGRSPERQQFQVDTAVVEVVRRQISLASLEIAPGSVTLAPGLSQTFLATGYLKDGRAVPVGATWTATGGSIDAGGKYVAGDTAGTYHVVATHTVLRVADTAVVTITAPAPPPPPPPAPPAPVLASVTLVPGSATLAASTTRQFTAYGTTTAGDSVSLSVVFAATGGVVTETGLYTAGSTAGTYRIIATAGTLADTSTLTVTSPLGSGGSATGIPFGPFSAWDGTQLKPNADLFTATFGAVSPDIIVARIASARAKGDKMILAMTGGHERYLTDFGRGKEFDRAKWNARMQEFNTSTIKSAIAAGVADGTIIGADVMDEPNVSGLGDGNTWGPKGTMTKARVDSLCGYVKMIFPSIPVGVSHNHDTFEPTKSYRVCEFIVSQYAYRKGDVTQWRDAGLALARRDGHKIAFSLNSLSGGIQAARDGLWNCPLTTTGGRGSFDPNCKMTPQQIREFGRILGPAGCALFLWRYDDAMMRDPEYQRAFKDVATIMANAPASSCRRG